MADSVWGKPARGAWADDVDEQEHAGTLAGPPLGAKEEAFPDLATAAKEAPKKKGKGKPVSLSAFLGGGGGGGPRAAADEKAILLSLPKASSGAPREERDTNALGGAFRDYGGDRGGGGGFRGGRDRYGDREDGEGGGRRGPEPSRADEADDWGANRKFTPSESGGSRGFGGGGGGGGGGFRDRDGGGGGFGERRGFDERPPRREAAPSAADEADDWGANRKFTPSGDADRPRPGGGGAGAAGGGSFRDRDGPREGAERRRYDEPSRADMEDWSQRRAPPPAAAEERPGPSGQRRPGFGFSGNSAADSEDRWSRGTALPAGGAGSSSGPAAPGGGGGGGGGGDAPRERPKLTLAPRTKPVDAAPGSPSAANGTPQQKGDGGAKPNPFGAARPREEVLKEKGIDYVKEELKLEHGEVIRDKTPEEAALEKEVEDLRTRLEGMKELQSGETDTLKELEADLDAKETSLYKLQAELDDKVRFSKSRTEERRPPPEASDDRGFERAGPRRGGRGGGAAGGGDGEQQQQERGERGGGGGERGGERGDRPPRGSGGFRDRDGGRGRGPPPPQGERKPAW